MTPPPAPFEALRQYATAAVEQLLREMADQAVRYVVPAENVLALLETIAAARHKSPWDVYLDWVWRHGVPAHQLMETATTRPLTPDERLALRARLRDLFGYALLGLVLTETPQKLDNTDKN